MTPVKFRSRAWLGATALFAMAWVVVRACVQAVGVDEAVTYVNFAAMPFASHWAAHSNNHVLNSLVMRFFTSLFGPSLLMIRAGAVIGAAVYLYAAYRLSKLIGRDSGVAWAIFVCLAFNPLIFDYMVAARGYSMAFAFLTCAVGSVAWTLAQEVVERRALERACVLCSIFAALSFAANFSFAIVDAAAVLMSFLWAARAGLPSELPRKEALKAHARLLAACLVPGVVTAAYLVGATLLNWHEIQLVQGAASLRETGRVLLEDSLYKPSPFILSPLVLRAVQAIAPYIFPALGLFFAWRLAVILINRASIRDAHARWLLGFGAVLAGTVALTVLGHELLFHSMKILLPRDRTATFFVVLLTLLAGIAAAIPVPSRAGKWSRRGLAAMLFVLAGYYLCCIRLGFFKEWEFDSDVDKVYDTLAYYNHSCGLKDVAVNWRYDAGLNFYRQISGREPFPDFVGYFKDPGYPSGRRAYVLFYPEDVDYIAAHKLTVVYQADSGAVVALDPALQGDRPCEMTLPRTGIRP